ncbi:MAG: hypothetical protein ACI9MK_001150, partial [Oceanospirillaceae bacterium]
MLTLVFPALYPIAGMLLWSFAISSLRLLARRSLVQSMVLI